MEEGFGFQLQAVDTLTKARAGLLTTPHGLIPTPVFMPVGTQATVKAMSPRELRECQSSIILANTYHLHLRPGEELIRDAGGLHRFENWEGAILTDSGGFQVFSLREISRVGEDGVLFQSYLDGSKHLFSPEAVTRAQHDLGADIIMCFDECPPARSPEEKIREAVDRTLRWAGRCMEAHLATPFHHGYVQALFGIVQGGANRDLRGRCARELVAMGFPGYAIGGLAVGEAIEETYATAGFTCGLLPVDRPRYLMGVGTPQDLLNCIAAGVDMFDCVLPTRNARNGSAFTSQGKVNIRNSCHARDFAHGIDDECGCYSCRNFSRAYLRHLYMAGEILGIRLLTYHNIHFFLELVRQARERILQGGFLEWKTRMLRTMQGLSGSAAIAYNGRTDE